MGHLDAEIAHCDSNIKALEEMKAGAAADIESYEGAIANYQDVITTRRESIAACESQIENYEKVKARALADKAAGVEG